jgi:hypothetical protein
MSQDNSSIAEAINLPQPGATVLLPASDLAAILSEVRSLRETVREHDWRLDKHSDFIRILQEERRPVAPPGKKQTARLNRLEALLIARGNEPLTFSETGKYLELGSRTGKATTRRQNMTLLGKILESESNRFHVFDSKTQKGAKMVCLASEYFTKGKMV